MTAAKNSLVLLAALAAVGCTGGLKRLAPPGIVKYEELAGDQPVNPAIAETIAEQEGEAAGGFPKLAEQPTETPEGIARPERAAMEEALLEARDSLAEEIAADRAAAEGERASAISDDEGDTPLVNQ